MSLDLAEEGESLTAWWLAVALAAEAKVCLPELSPEGEMEVHAATYDTGQGLVVTDEMGVQYRLRVTAEPLNPMSKCHICGQPGGH